MLLLLRFVPRPERHPFDQFVQQWINCQHLHRAGQLWVRLEVEGAVGNDTAHQDPVGGARWQPGGAGGRQQADPTFQLHGHAAGLGEQQLMALMLMQARVVPAEGGGNADHAAGQLVGVKRVIGKNKGHMSDF